MEDLRTLTGMATIALFPESRRLFASPEPPALGPGPRAGAWSREQVNTAVDQLFDRISPPAARRSLLRALVLLWHDHFDPAHEIVQDGEDADSAWLHAILHRREPDYSNAKYWFRRVREHPGHGALAARVLALLGARGEAGLAAQLVPQGRWDPFAFVDACGVAAGHSARDTRTKLLCEIQGIEFEVLLEHLCRPG
jgi:hypothetical protein